MSTPVAQADVEAEIMRLSHQLDWQVGEIAKRARNAADAEVDHKIAMAKSLLTVEGDTVGAREAQSLLDNERSYRAHKTADAVLYAAQEAGRSLRSQLDALRSILASVRAATLHSEGYGG